MINKTNDEVKLEAADITIGKVKMEDGTSTKLAVINEANTARTTSTNTLVTQVLDESGAVLKTSVIAGDTTSLDTKQGTTGEAAAVDGTRAAQLRYIGEQANSKLSIPPYTHSSGRGDFTAAYTSNVTITLAGEPATVTNEQISSLTITDTAGTTTTTFVNGQNGVAMSISASVITITGAGTPFASGDTYDVRLNLFDKAYDIATDSLQNSTLNPDYSRYLTESVVDETNVAAATNYYPSASGGVMDGYRHLGFTGKFIDADGTITLTIEGTNDEDATPANRDWIQLYAFDNKNDTTTNSVAITNGTITFALNFEFYSYKYYRCKVVNDGATNTIIIKSRKVF